MSQPTTHRIVILGGGFGGLYAALELERAAAKDPSLDVTLVNRENFFLFTPMLHEVAASDLDMTTIINPVRKLLRHVKFVTGAVEQIDLPAKRVRVDHGSDHHKHDLAYDHLVLSLGSVTNFFNLPGLQERAITMKSLGDAIELRNRIIANLEEADTECAAAYREPLLTFVVAGGGFAGVETIAAVNDYVREAARFYSNLRTQPLRVLLVHPGSVILPELGEKLGRYAEQKLAQRGVEIRLNTKVTGVGPDEVRLSDGTVIKARTLVWTAGISPNPLLDALPCPKERGRIPVNQYLEVREWPGVWAIGDCALVPDLKSGQWHPPTAQHAVREGTTVARNILATVRGRAKRPFAFTTLGQLASIGRRTGVANLFGMQFSGFFAWWMWRTIYLSKLPRLEKKVRVALDWTLDLLFSKDLVQVMTWKTPAISRSETEPAAVRVACDVQPGGHHV